MSDGRSERVGWPSYGVAAVALGLLGFGAGSEPVYVAGLDAGVIGLLLAGAGLAIAAARRSTELAGYPLAVAVFYPGTGGMTVGTALRLETYPGVPFALWSAGVVSIGVGTAAYVVGRVLAGESAVPERPVRVVGTAVAGTVLTVVLGLIRSPFWDPPAVGF